jgi:hypothetical protein
MEEKLTRVSNQPKAARSVVKTYGRRNLLGVLSLMFAWLMARQGMHGAQEAAAREMEDDAVAMSRGGYRVVDSKELGLPQLGIVYYRVTYELMEPSVSAT